MIFQFHRPDTSFSFYPTGKTYDSPMVLKCVCDWCGKEETIPEEATEGRWVDCLQRWLNWVSHEEQTPKPEGEGSFGPDGPVRLFCSRRCRHDYLSNKYPAAFTHETR